MDSFTAYGHLVEKRSNPFEIEVEVEGVDYWFSAQDALRVAQGVGIRTDGLKVSEYGITGQKVKVIVHRDENGCWAELANQPTYCPIDI